jgi:hypothetical protein
MAYSVQNGDFDISYEEVAKPNGALVGVPGGGKDPDGWLKQVYRCNGELYVRAVRFEGKQTITKWMHTVVSWRHCQCPVDANGNIRSREEDRCRNAQKVEAVVRDVALIRHYKICADCVPVLLKVIEGHKQIDFFPLPK